MSEKTNNNNSNYNKLKIAQNKVEHMVNMFFCTQTIYHNLQTIPPRLYQNFNILFKVPSSFEQIHYNLFIKMCTVMSSIDSVCILSSLTILN